MTVAVLHMDASTAHWYEAILYTDALESKGLSFNCYRVGCSISMVAGAQSRDHEQAPPCLW